mgnify:CR=1 FL=1
MCSENFGICLDLKIKTNLIESGRENKILIFRNLQLCSKHASCGGRISDDEDNDEYSSPILKYVRGLAHNISCGRLSLILDKFLDKNFFDGLFFDDIFADGQRQKGGYEDVLN